MNKRKCNCGCGLYLTEQQRFWQKVNKTDTCWNWNKELDKNGYGRFQVNRIGIRAHRYSYELVMGKIPKGLVIDHLCRNPKCVNPKHLEAVTNKENILRGNGVAAINSVKTKCIHGHELLGNNLIVQKNGKRNCKECGRIAAREYQRAKSKNRKTKLSIA